MTSRTPRRTALKQIASFAALGLGVSACSKPADPVPPAAGAGTTAKAGGIVEFLYPDNPSFDLIYLAEKLGYFEGTSTRPKYIGKVAAPQIIPLVGTGEIHFGARMVPLVISAIASGADIQVIASGGKTLQEAPHMKYFVRKDSGIRTPKDLEGRTIGINSFGACAEFVTKNREARGPDGAEDLFAPGGTLGEHGLERAAQRGRLRLELRVVHPERRPLAGVESLGGEHDGVVAFHVGGPTHADQFRAVDRQVAERGGGLRQFVREHFDGRHDAEAIALEGEHHGPGDEAGVQAVGQGHGLDQPDHRQIAPETAPALRGVEHRQREQRPEHHIHADHQEKETLAAGQHLVRRRVPDAEDEPCRGGGDQQAQDEVDACGPQAGPPGDAWHERRQRGDTTGRPWWTTLSTVSRNAGRPELRGNLSC